MVVIFSFHRKIVRRQAKWHLLGCIFYIFKCTEWIQLWMRYAGLLSICILEKFLLFVGVGVVVGKFSIIAEEWWVSDMVVQLAMAKDPEAAFFKRLEGLQPCEVSELKAGTHIFAVYGLNCYFCTSSFASFFYLHNITAWCILFTELLIFFQEIIFSRLPPIQSRHFVQSHTRIQQRSLKTLRHRF